EMQQGSGGETDESRDQQAAHGNGGRGRADPAARDQAEDHGAESRDETQRQVAAAVEQERFGPGQQVEKPDVERLPEIRILVPVRGEAGEVVLPVRGYASSWMHWVDGPCEPVAEEYEGEREP